MHLLIIAIGSAGDVYPFVSIGKAAAVRGHRVTVCTSPVFRPDVEASGLAFRAVGTSEDYLRAIADPALWQPRTSLRVLWRIVASTLSPLHDLLSAEAGADTVMLGSLWAFSARVLQETHGIPYISAHVSPSTLLSAFAPPEHAGLKIAAWWPVPVRRVVLRLAETCMIDRLMTPALNRLRRDQGLAPTGRVMSRWMHSSDGVLALFPSWFAKMQPDWPSPLSFAGFPLFDHPGGDTLDPQLLEFLEAGAPPVVLTVGSTPTDDSFISRALTALVACAQRVVVIAPVTVVVPPGGEVLVRQNVPLPPLLARCKAIWHHGGIGTTALALRAGLPQFVTPFAHDQFDNARRVVGLGAGMRARPTDSAGDLARELRRLLTDPGIAASCLGLAQRACEDSGALACHKAVDIAEACSARAARHQTPGPDNPPRTGRADASPGAPAPIAHIEHSETANI